MTTTIESPRHLIVLGHPAPGSFNHQVAKHKAVGINVMMMNG